MPAPTLTRADTVNAMLQSGPKTTDKYHQLQDAKTVTGGGGSSGPPAASSGVIFPRAK